VNTDPDGVQFLQWCLPQLNLRWPGFRKVRRQVLKRIGHRLRELGLPSLDGYRTFLADHPSEWATLDTLCWISVSRFYRDRQVFQSLEHEILPRLASLVMDSGEIELRCWSAGCAGGEEPYTLAILWKQRLTLRFPMLDFRIVATDIDPQAIQRAQRGCYPWSSVKELPAEWRAQALVASGEELCLKDEYRAFVTFLVQDLRECAPEGQFQLILCRNFVFTYFDEKLQRRATQRLSDSLGPGGALVIGKTESLPDGLWEIEPWSPKLGTYRKVLKTPSE
jgi:chemotaxis protein methyltransferase CheR